jgi:squalene/oxidosqualene cyclase-like protein
MPKSSLETPPVTGLGAVRKGLRFLSSIQEEDGSWRGDYDGPMFILPAYVIASYVGEHMPASDQGRRLAAYVWRAQNPDGGIVLYLHTRESAMLSSVLCYVALRLLGVDPGDHRMTRLRAWIRDHGTALACPAWGKWFLALLNLYDYSGLPALLPELYLLPAALPIHPGRWWLPSRQGFLPMSYLFAKRARIPENDLIKALRREIYRQDYGSIRFRDHRATVAPGDNFAPVPLLARLAGRLASFYDAHHSRALRERALQVVLDHLRFDERSSGFVCMAWMPAALSTLVHHFEDPGGEAVRRSWEGLAAYLWEKRDGLKVHAQTSTALWDTVLSVQAILATPFADLYARELGAAYGFIRDNQILEELPDRARYFRHARYGGWPFTDLRHGLPVADCTAEALKCALALEGRAAEPIPAERLAAALRLILSLQNRDGGWATYERQRVGHWIEKLNSCQLFRDAMADYSYVECTSSCLQALAAARGRVAAELAPEIERAIARGSRFVRRQQRADGSWEGGWGICFTYGTWFAVAGLLAAGANREDTAVVRAGDFLVRHQNPDGGWGEDYTSCIESRYVPCESQVVNTAWALLALAQAGRAGGDAALRAVRFLCAIQQEDGDWPQQNLPGVFRRTGFIQYENYRRYFSLWALASALEP